MLGRLRAKAFLIKRAQDVNMAYFNHAASTIQKVFRGYWSRQYTHCMKSRKDYLAQVASVGDKTNTWLKGFEGEEQLKHQRRTEEERKSTFNKLASQLHHLVSTQKIPGVYNPPYSEALPTAFNIPIEVPAVYQDPRRAAQPLAKRVPLVTRTANAGRMQAIQGPFRTKEQIDISNVKAYDQHRSIQASSRYDVVQQTKRLEARLSKITRVAPDEFVSRKIEHGKLKPSVNAETRYLDRPVEFRQDYTELPKIKDKPPFFTAVPGGKLLADYDDEKYIVGAMPV
eukprot:g10434.t1